jgi:hypothetical protein
VPCLECGEFGCVVSEEFTVAGCGQVLIVACRKSTGWITSQKLHVKVVKKLACVSSSGRRYHSNSIACDYACRCLLRAAVHDAPLKGSLRGGVQQSGQHVQHLLGRRPHEKTPRESSIQSIDLHSLPIYFKLGSFDTSEARSDWIGPRVALDLPLIGRFCCSISGLLMQYLLVLLTGHWY